MQTARGISNYTLYHVWGLCGLLAELGQKQQKLK